MEDRNQNPFQREKYDKLERFISYYYQIKLVREISPKNLLEVGIGSKVVSEYLKSMGIKVTTCDINPALLPDKVGDLRNLPFENETFEAVAVFEVLEHIPFSDLEQALKEISRVSKKYAIISLPYRHICFEMILKFPFIRTILKKSFLDFCFRFPLVFHNEKDLGEHHWELGLKKYSFKIIRKHLSRHFKIIKEARPVLNSYHHFFILEKLYGRKSSKSI